MINLKKLAVEDVQSGIAVDHLDLSKNVNLFQDKEWSTESVFKDTLEDFKKENLTFEILAEKIDLDTVEDLKNFPNL